MGFFFFFFFLITFLHHFDAVFTPLTGDIRTLYCCTPSHGVCALAVEGLRVLVLTDADEPLKCVAKAASANRHPSLVSSPAIFQLQDGSHRLQATGARCGHQVCSELGAIEMLRCSRCMQLWACPVARKQSQAAAETPPAVECNGIRHLFPLILATLQLFARHLSMEIQIGVITASGRPEQCKSAYPTTTE